MRLNRKILRRLFKARYIGFDSREIELLREFVRNEYYLPLGKPQTILRSLTLLDRNKVLDVQTIKEVAVFILSGDFEKIFAGSDDVIHIAYLARFSVFSTFFFPMVASGIDIQLVSEVLKKVIKEPQVINLETLLKIIQKLQEMRKRRYYPVTTLVDLLVFFNFSREAIPISELFGYPLEGQKRSKVIAPTSQSIALRAFLTKYDKMPSIISFEYAQAIVDSIIEARREIVRRILVASETFPQYLVEYAMEVLKRKLKEYSKVISYDILERISSLLTNSMFDDAISTLLYLKYYEVYDFDVSKLLAWLRL